MQTAENRTTTREKGQPQNPHQAINFIQDLKNYELAMPRRLFTYDDMARDEAIKQPLELTQILVSLGLANGSFEGGKSRESKAAADFLNYTIHNMPYGTWYEACQNMVSSIKYGFAFLNPVMEYRNHGEYAGSFCLKKLAPRSQHSLHGWIYDNSQREVLGILQKPLIKTTGPHDRFGGGVKRSNINSLLKSSDLTPIYNKNLLRFTHDSINNNPQGNSPLNACFESWTEKQIIQQYEVIGVSKDLGGLVVVRIPDELMKKAQNPGENPEDARAYLNLEEQVANIHAGKQSYIMLSDETSSDGKNFSYDIKLVGIDGAGKQYKTSEIIEQKKKAMYNAFGAGFLLLGQDTHGSYNIASNGKLVHSFYIERDTAEIVSVINTSLTPKILAANRVRLSHKDTPKFVPANPDQLSLDEAGKFIQRTASVNKLAPKTAEEVVRLTGLTSEGMSSLDFESKGESRSGESMGTSGTGSTQDGGIGSSVNVENTGVTKSYVLDSTMESPSQMVAVNVESGEHIYLSKEE